jgi:hypothetical protein
MQLPMFGSVSCVFDMIVVDIFVDDEVPLAGMSGGPFFGRWPRFLNVKWIVWYSTGLGASALTCANKQRTLAVR